MQERALSPAVRIIAGIVSAAILIIALFVAATQVRVGSGSDIRAWLAAAGVIIVALGAMRMLRAAIRGTIRIRGSGTPG